LSGRDLDAVALELDDERAASLLSDHPPESGPGDAPFFLRIWGHVQKRLGEELGAGAGGEMKAAARIAKESNLPIFLIDDPIRATLGRLVKSMSLRERLSLLVGGLLGAFLPASIVEGQLDKYTEAPQEYLEVIREAYPSLARVLLDE